MKRNKETPIVLVVLFLVSTAGVVDGANLISNPGFESGTTSWTFYTNGGGTFTTPSPGYEGNKTAKLALNNGGSNIQLYQTGVTLEANTRYRLSFAAYSNTGHDITVRLQKHTSPYTSYMPEFTVNLGTSWQAFSNEFISTGFSGTVNDGRLMFWLAPFAAAGDNYYIDDVRLEKINLINSCTKISSPGEYLLTQSIINSGVTNCINITSSDVIFNGSGYTIDGDGITNYGLYARNVNRITIKNLVIQDWNTRGVNIVNSNNNNFSNITVISGNYDGFSLQNSNNNILRNMKVLNTGNVGFVFENSYGNDLKDSVFQNNAWEDFDIYLTGGVSGCNNEVGNVSLTKYQLYYYNKSIDLKDIYAGAIYLCNADNSTVTNATVTANGQNSISNYYVENVTYTDITTSGLQEAIFFKYSENNNITNILMKDGWSGISYSTNTTNTNFKNATIYNMTDRAIRIYGGASKNIISDSKISNNSVGIYLNTAGKYGPNRIYNSFFNNTNNIEWGISDFFGDGSVYHNYWNITRQLGTNIIGGPFLGGNFWAYPNGTGFSQTCTDADGDGICDSTYVLKNNNTDYLPLAYNAASGHVHNINKGTNYTTIQAAIDDASAGDEIHVDSGIYPENVNINKKLTLRGIGMPVVDASGSGSAITLAVDGIVLEGFTATNASTGILLTSNNNTLSSNNASNNANSGIRLVSSSNNTLIGNSVSNNHWIGGIMLLSSSNNTLITNNALFNLYGIVLESSSNNTLIGNNASNNFNSGIRLGSSSNNTLIGNNASNNNKYEGEDSIRLVFSNNNILLSNIVNNNFFGIFLFSSGNNTISSNTANNNFFGIVLESSSNNIINNNIFNNSNNVLFQNSIIDTWNITKTPGTNIIGGSFLGGNFWAHPNGTGFSQTCTDADDDGICDSAYVLDSNNTDYLPLAYYSPAGSVHNINKGTNYTTIQAAIDDASAGDEIHVDSGIYPENVNINKKLTLRGIGMPVVDASGSGSAITLAVDGIVLEGFTATNGTAGISVASNNSMLIGNNASHNEFNVDFPKRCGIKLSSSDNNTLIDNNAFYNNIGISLSYSNNNTLIDNNASNNKWWSGIELDSSNNNTLIGNIANYNTPGWGGDGRGNGITLRSSSDNMLIGNNANSNLGNIIWPGSGIVLESSSNNILISNNASNGGSSGIWLTGSNNKLIGNNASNNGISYLLAGGITLDGSNNLIYNNIFNNTNNVRFFYESNVGTWNITRQSGTNIIGGPFLGGNFWAHPNGTGFSQICTDADGNSICDSAYALDSNNTDYLPLAYYSPAGPVYNINKGTNYTTIQAAIEDASPGDEIHVDSGNYLENLNVNKRLTLRGIGMPVVDAGGSGSAIKLAAEGIILEGFTATNTTAGISVASNNCMLIGNIARNNDYNHSIFSGFGIILYGSNNTLISNNASYNGIGIVMENSNNNTLIGNNVSNNDWWGGIILSSSNNNSLMGNNVNYNLDKHGDGKGYGIGIKMWGNYPSNNNTLIGNNISNNYFGIFLDASGKNNNIYNNIFNNNNDVRFDGLSVSTWNITRQSGTNIVGGPFFGGNFWANPDGTGFSQTCTDADGDGICDSAYVFDSNNTDYLPLALPSIPLITVVSPNGGENWERGSTQVIRWNYAGSPGPNVRIELLKNELLNSVLTSGTPIGSSGSGSYNWLINSTQTPDADYKVRITSTDNSTYTDTSNNNFIISSVSDTSPPAIIGSTPTGTNVPVTTQITVTFNESMNQSSAQAAFSTSPPTSGSFSWGGNMMTYTPDSILLANTTYNVTIETSAKDLAGNNLQSPYNWSFTTGALPSIEERLASLEANMTALQSRVTALETENTALKNVLAGVSRNGSDIYVDGANVHIRDGSGDTYGPVNGLGNLIIGYNELRGLWDNRTGSHNLVLGSMNSYLSYGGLVAGKRNNISGEYASVSGGENNQAIGGSSSVSGGHSNTAWSSSSSVSGGVYNGAFGMSSSVSGGEHRNAWGDLDWVAGGLFQDQ